MRWSRAALWRSFSRISRLARCKAMRSKRRLPKRKRSSILRASCSPITCARLSRRALFCPQTPCNGMCPFSPTRCNFCPLIIPIHTISPKTFRKPPPRCSPIAWIARKRLTRHCKTGFFLLRLARANGRICSIPRHVPCITIPLRNGYTSPPQASGRR